MDLTVDAKIFFFFFLINKLTLTGVFAVVYAGNE